MQATCQNDRIALDCIARFASRILTLLFDGQEPFARLPRYEEQAPQPVIAGLTDTSTPEAPPKAPAKASWGFPFNMASPPSFARLPTFGKKKQPSVDPVAPSVEEEGAKEKARSAAPTPAAAQPPQGKAEPPGAAKEEPAVTDVKEAAVKQSEVPASGKPVA